MTYSETIQKIANTIADNFTEVYHSAETVQIDNAKFPGVISGENWINLSPDDSKEIIYIRKAGDDSVYQEMKIGSCFNSYKMRTPIRIVYFRDYDYEKPAMAKIIKIAFQSFTELTRIITDKWKLQKEESNGEYNFGASTIYFAVEMNVIWHLIPDSCEESDFCLDQWDNNPIKCVSLNS